MANEKHDLIHSIGDVESGIMQNLEMMAHDDPSVRATARLNRDLVAAVDKFLAAEASNVDVTDIMISTMHGVSTVCGSVLVNIPPSERPDALKAMRSELIDIFDAMGKIVTEEKQ